MKKKVYLLAAMGLLTAMELIICFTPLGSIPIVPGVIVVTLSHIPVIIAGIFFGYWAGAFMGAVFGISSLIVWSTSLAASPVAFVFTPFAPNGNFFSLLICLLPRILLGVIAAGLYKLLSRRLASQLSTGITAAIATFLHSAMVLTGIFLAFRGNAVVGGSYVNFIVAWGGVNALLEIAAAVVLVVPIVFALQKAMKQR